MEEEILTWEAPEFVYREKSSDWYWILGIVVVAGILLAIMNSNILFALLIGIGGFIFGVYASKHPDTLVCGISRKGIQVNNKFYPHASIDTFWVEDRDGENQKLLLTLKKHLAMQVVIPVRDIHPDDVRDYLLDYIDEEEQQESFTERVMELVKF